MSWDAFPTVGCFAGPVLNCPKPGAFDPPEGIQSAQCALNSANEDLDHLEDGPDAAEHEEDSTERGSRRVLLEKILRPRQT